MTIFVTCAKCFSTDAPDKFVEYEKRDAVYVLKTDEPNKSGDWWLGQYLCPECAAAEYIKGVDSVYLFGTPSQRSRARKYALVFLDEAQQKRLLKWWNLVLEAASIKPKSQADVGWDGTTHYMEQFETGEDE